MQIEKEQRNNRNDHKYSIIIPTWNNLPHLQLVIRSIKENSTFKHQIIIHINDGSDGTYEWVQQQEDLDYTYSEKKYWCLLRDEHCSFFGDNGLLGLYK